MSINSDDDSAIEQLMGFSSFGNHKKARHAHGQPQIPQEPRFTSSNAIPLSRSRSDLISTTNVVETDPQQLSNDQQEQYDTFFTTTSAPNQLDLTEVQPVALNTNPGMPTHSYNNTHLDPSYPSYDPTRTGGDDRNRRHHPQDAEEICYSNPETGISFTRRQLDEYAKGKEEVLPDGSRRKVFFRPSFVEDDLWNRWDGQVKAREKLESERGEMLGTQLAPTYSAIGGI